MKIGFIDKYKKRVLMSHAKNMFYNRFFEKII